MLRVILPHLPPGSAFKRALNPGMAVWGPAEYILADLFDVLAGANWQRANQGEQNPSPRPAMYPRPAPARQPVRPPAPGAEPVTELSSKEQRIQALLAQRERARARQAAGG